MKVRVIKRIVQERTTAEAIATVTSQPKEIDARHTMAKTVKSWIKELRQTRETERLLSEKL
jgi:Asp/Glu/hydantoin racemase